LIYWNRWYGNESCLEVVSRIEMGHFPIGDEKYRRSVDYRILEDMSEGRGQVRVMRETEATIDKAALMTRATFIS